MDIRSGRDEGAWGLVEAVVERAVGEGREALKVSQRAPARRSRVDPGDDIEEGRLARPIGAGDAKDLSPSMDRSTSTRAAKLPKDLDNPFVSRITSEPFIKTGRVSARPAGLRSGYFIQGCLT